MSGPVPAVTSGPRTDAWSEEALDMDESLLNASPPLGKFTTTDGSKAVLAIELTHPVMDTVRLGQEANA